MSIPIIQAPSILLPTWHPLNTEHEDITDLVEHTSQEVYIADIHEKVIHIVAVENWAGGVIGALNVWVELSPVSSATAAGYWAAIGGGGGTQAPTAPLAIAANNAVPGDTHTELMPWVIHSHWCRVVVQCPVNALPLVDYWQVQIVLAGKTP